MTDGYKLERICKEAGKAQSHFIGFWSWYTAIKYTMFCSLSIAYEQQKQCFRDCIGGGATGGDPTVLGLSETARSSDGLTLWNKPNTARSPHMTQTDAVSEMLCF
jgi:hypothetical protein